MKDVRFMQFVVFVNAVVPLAMLCWDAYEGHLVDPVNNSIRTTGMLALVFLTLSLAVTPVRIITGLNWLFTFRRTLGLFAFFYGCLHLLLFYALDRSLNLSSTIHEILYRRYIWFGAFALLYMAPLAATSTAGMIKRLGAKRWKSLHRLAYAAAVAGVIHFYMLVKADERLPLTFAASVGILLAYRLLPGAGKARPKAVHVAAPSGGAR